MRQLSGRWDENTKIDRDHQRMQYDWRNITERVPFPWHIKNLTKVQELYHLMKSASLMMGIGSVGWRVLWAPCPPRRANQGYNRQGNSQSLLSPSFDHECFNGKGKTRMILFSLRLMYQGPFGEIAEVLNFDPEFLKTYLNMEGGKRFGKGYYEVNGRIYWLLCPRGGGDDIFGRVELVS
jgi:hypothetical protein